MPPRPRTSDRLVPTVSHRVNAERLVLLAWARAILLQFAHPLIAAGVLEHSSFRIGRLSGAVRLHHTVHAMLSLTFGSGESRAATLARIRGIHTRVNGTLSVRVGPYHAGTRYSAEDPTLLLWVHATLLESVLMVYERIVQPLSEADRDRYCEEAAPVVRALGVSDGEPHTWRELRSSLERTYATGAIAVGPHARELASALLAPPLSWTIAPARRVNRLFAVGLLPPFIREQYGFSWTAADARALDRWTGRLHRLRAIAPTRIATWKAARTAASR